MESCSYMHQGFVYVRRIFGGLGKLQRLRSCVGVGWDRIILCLKYGYGSFEGTELAPFVVVKYHARLLRCIYFIMNFRVYCRNVEYIRIEFGY